MRQIERLDECQGGVLHHGGVNEEVHGGVNEKMSERMHGGMHGGRRL